MFHDFSTIEYLKSGNERQRLAYITIMQYHLVEALEQYTPILVGTVPLAIDLPESDLDILCNCKHTGKFAEHLEQLFSTMDGFNLRSGIYDERPTVICNFKAGQFEFEIFGQHCPVEQQKAYQHMLIEHRLLLEKGEEFRAKVIALKKRGFKTEPAFAKLLGLSGNPYDELLKVELWD